MSISAILTIIKYIWSRPYLLLPLVIAATWFAKGVVEEFECKNEARVAALKIELANEKTISDNNEKLRQAATQDVERLAAENQKRKERNNALIEQFKDSDCTFSDDELERLR